MASTTTQLAALANDPSFRSRLSILLAQQAAVVLAESTGTTNHAQRAAYARQVIANPGGFAQNAAVLLASRTNLTSANTTFDFGSGHILTDATDAALLSQIATDWDLLAGV